MLLIADHLAKRFPNGVEALADLSFALNDGDFVSLLGPSGCGKSTALRLIAGLLAPDGGAVTFLPATPQMGFVFQEPTLMPWADALTNARLPEAWAIAAAGSARVAGQLPPRDAQPLYVDPPEAKLPAGGLRPTPACRWICSM